MDASSGSATSLSSASPPPPASAPLQSSSAALASPPPPPPRLKIVVFGPADAGKTALIKRLCEGKFASRYGPTIGVDYGVRPERLPRPAGGSAGSSSSSSSSSASSPAAPADVRVNFFDLGGQDAYKDVRVEFYGEANAVSEACA
jgi:DnaJ family protein C protein 27